MNKAKLFLTLLRLVPIILSTYEKVMQAKEDDGKLDPQEIMEIIDYFSKAVYKLVTGQELTN